MSTRGDSSEDTWAKGEPTPKEREGKDAGKSTNSSAEDKQKIPLMPGVAGDRNAAVGIYR